jgi:hypothetical protein
MKAVCIIPFRNGWGSGGSTHDPRSGAMPPEHHHARELRQHAVSGGLHDATRVLVALGNRPERAIRCLTGSGMSNHESRKLPESTTRVDDIGQGLPSHPGSKFVAFGRSNGLKIIDRCGGAPAMARQRATLVRDVCKAAIAASRAAREKGFLVPNEAGGPRK